MLSQVLPNDGEDELGWGTPLVRLQNRAVDQFVKFGERQDVIQLDPVQLIVGLFDVVESLVNLLTFQHHVAHKSLEVVLWRQLLPQSTPKLRNLTLPLAGVAVKIFVSLREV